MGNSYLHTLKLFNEKAEKLNDLSFTKEVTTKKHGVTFNFNEDRSFSVKRRGPAGEAMDAFVLTLRFFIQDNEKSSLRNLAEIYEKLPILDQKKDRFRRFRKLLNNFLDDKSFYSTRGINCTNRQIMDIFIYGGLAHANKEKKEIYDEWMSDSVSEPLTTNEFVKILQVILGFIISIKRINERVIEELEQNT